MIGGVSNVHIGAELLKTRFTINAVLGGVKHTVSLFFNYVSKFQVLNQIIKAHKAIYNLFDSEI